MLVKYREPLFLFGGDLFIPRLNFYIQKLIVVQLRDVDLENIHVLQFFFESFNQVVSLLLRLLFLHCFDLGWHVLFIRSLFLGKRLEEGATNLNNIVHEYLVIRGVSDSCLVDELQSFFCSFYSYFVVDLRLQVLNHLSCLWFLLSLIKLLLKETVLLKSPL